MSQAEEAEKTRIHLPIVGEVALPPTEHLAFYAGVAAMTAIELIEWPVALVIGLGKLLSDNRSHKRLQGIGDAMEDAG